MLQHTLIVHWGGAPGKAGIDGKIEFLDLRNPENSKKTPQDGTEDSSTKDGEPGNAGNPGKAGKHKKHGKDLGVYAQCATFKGRLVNFFSAREKRNIQEICGELEHSKIKPDPGSGKQYEVAAKGLPRQRKSENHPDFINRGEHQNGKTSQTKVNTALANENKAINKQSCLKSMEQQCKQSLQHWNKNFF